MDLAETTGPPTLTILTVPDLTVLNRGSRNVFFTAVELGAYSEIDPTFVAPMKTSTFRHVVHAVAVILDGWLVTLAIRSTLDPRRDATLLVDSS